MITLHSGLAPEWLAASRARSLMASGILRGFGTVIAVSEPIAQAVLRCGVAQDRIQIVHAFSAAFLEPGELPRAVAKVRAEASPLLCAMLAPERIYGAQELFVAFAAIRATRPRAHLAVFGPGTRPHELRPLADQLAGPAGHQVLGLGEIGRP